MQAQGCKQEMIQELMQTPATAEALAARCIVREATYNLTLTLRYLANPRLYKSNGGCDVP